MILIKFKHENVKFASGIVDTNDMNLTKIKVFVNNIRWCVTMILETNEQYFSDDKEYEEYYSKECRL